MDMNQVLAAELNVKPWQVEAAVKLIDEGNTIPFISRYRKEATGSLNDEILRNLYDRLMYLRSLNDRKAVVLASIEEQGKLTAELKKSIEEAATLVVVEDLYRPYRPKRRTRATIAKEKGLEPLANIILLQMTKEPLEKEAEAFVSEEKEVKTAKDAIAGACDIIAESISDEADYRMEIRRRTEAKGLIVSTAKDEKAESVYENYYEFSEPVSKIAGHRVLALNRGEKEKFLNVKIEAPTEEILRYLEKKIITKENPQTKPVGVLVLGDTNSCLSVIGAKRLHIPIFHMEAGNRCKDECLPEETNRRIVDIISDVNMAYSEHARRYLADCGLPKERTYVTGSPMAEVLHNNLTEIEASDVHQRLGLEKGKYILLSAHREENIDTEKNFLSLFTAINKMAEKYNMPILYSCHPRSRNRLATSGFILDERVIQHEPLGFHDYNCLQMNAFAVVSDSGTLPEESSFFTSVGHPFPAICIRTSTERPEAIDKGNFIIAGIDEKSLLQAVDAAVGLCKDGQHGIPVPDYIDENVSTKVIKIVQSYVGIVNKMVWRKF